MSIGLHRNFTQFFNDMGRWRQVWIAHAKIDNVLTRLPRGRPHRVHFGDDIRRQALDAVEFFGHLNFPV